MDLVSTLGILFAIFVYMELQRAVARTTEEEAGLVEPGDSGEIKADGVKHPEH